MEDKLRRLDTWIDEYTAVFPFSGIVRISKDDGMIYERCVGLADREWQIPIGPDTRFRLYSMTKPFTALAVMTLVDRGLVSLDEHPGKYVPLAAKLDRRITVRTVLNHNGGLPDFRQSPESFIIENALPLSYERMFRAMEVLPLNFEPGTDAYYSNFNFFLASVIVEEVTGRRFNEYLQHEVFDALGMEDACVDAMNRIVPRRARGYGVDGMEIVGAEAPCIDWMQGSGNGMATAKDIYQLNRAIKNHWLISEAAWREVLTPAKGKFGLGMSVMRWHDRLRYTHNGGHYGFRTLHVQLPEDDFDLILLSNMGFGNARNSFAEAVYRIFYGAEKTQAGPEMDKGFVRDGEVRFDRLSPRRPEKAKEGAERYAGRYAGLYAGAEYEAAVEISDGEGTITLGGTQRMPVYYTGNGVFQHRLIDESYAFTENARGKIQFMGMEKQER